jgi:hypothetical protein
MGRRNDWQEIRLLGGGGQSDVFLVRTPKRLADRTGYLVRSSNTQEAAISRAQRNSPKPPGITRDPKPRPNSEP